MEPTSMAEVDVPTGTDIVELDFVINIPDLRNGEVANIQQAAPKASVASAYKWAAITHLPAASHVAAVDFVIRGTYAQLVSAGSDGITEAQKTELRTHAIVLGAVRAGATSALKLTAGDMNITECASSGYEYNVATKKVMAANSGSTAGGKHAIAVGMASLTRTEVAVVSGLVYLGMAVPILQGASLVNTGHHYLPTTRNIFAGMKRQALGLMSEEAQAWVNALGDRFDDLAFHKACHPISPPFKRSLAKQTSVAMRLTASGHGAAAIRLPAIPSDAAIGKTCIALARSASATIRAMGHTIDVSEGPRLVAALERADEGAAEREAVQAITSWAQANMSTIAFCAGIVQQVHESVGTGRNTLLSAYSVKKLMADDATSVSVGVAYARAAAAKKKQELESGQFPDPKISV